MKKIIYFIKIFRDLHYFDSSKLQAHNELFCQKNYHSMLERNPQKIQFALLMTFLKLIKTVIISPSLIFEENRLKLFLKLTKFLKPNIRCY